MEKPSRSLGENGNHTDFPERLAGLDIAEGIQRLGGDPELYVEMVGEYCQAHREFAKAFRALVAQKDFPAARRTAHSLKGAAGNISAKELHRAAKELEDACAGQDEARAMALLPVVEKALDQIGASAEKLDALLSGGGKADRTGPESAKPAHEPARLSELLHILSESIKARDPVKSSQIIDAIDAGSLAEYLLKDFGRLKTQVRNYDFPAARTTLETLTAKQKA